MYYTNNLKIEVLSKNTVKLTNDREGGRVYLLDAIRFYLLLKKGGSKWKIPTKTGGYEKISFNLKHHPAGKHLTSAGALIATYIAHHDYKLLLRDLESSIKSDHQKILQEEMKDELS